jgi:hypothetical protein
MVSSQLLASSLKKDIQQDFFPPTRKNGFNVNFADYMTPHKKNWPHSLQMAGKMNSKHDFSSRLASDFN